MCVADDAAHRPAADPARHGRGPRARCSVDAWSTPAWSSPGLPGTSGWCSGPTTCSSVPAGSTSPAASCSSRSHRTTASARTWSARPGSWSWESVSTQAPRTCHILALPIRHTVDTLTPTRGDTMLGRNAYEPDELENARAAVKKQLADWRTCRRRRRPRGDVLQRLVLALDRPLRAPHPQDDRQGHQPAQRGRAARRLADRQRGGSTQGTVIKYAAGEVRPRPGAGGRDPADRGRLRDASPTAFLDELEKRSVS